MLMSFPPHCSRKLQPLDLSVFGPLKKRTSRAQQNWMRNHPGVDMTIHDIPDSVGEAWTDSVTPRNVAAGFVKAGGLYRENAIAIESEARDPFGGNVYYVTMQITFPIPEFARKERNLHCDVVHVTTKWVSRLVLDHAIAAIPTSR